MTTQQFRNNQQASVGTPTAAGVEVITPTRKGQEAGAGGGRIFGRGVAAVNTPTVFPGPFPGGFPTPPAGGNAPLGNPDFPCIAGPQIQPLTPTSVTIDTGTGYFFRHQRNASALTRSDLQFTSEFAAPNQLQQHMVAFDYFQGGLNPTDPDNSMTYTQPVDYVLPLRAVQVPGGSTAQVWNPITDSAGTGTILNALSSAGGMCVRMDGSAPALAQVGMLFDPTQLNDWLYNLTTGAYGGRIVELKLRYRAWRNALADPAPGEGFAIYYTDSGYPSASPEPSPYFLFLAAWLVTQYQSSAPTVSKSLGEVNYATRGYAFEHSTAGGQTWHAHPYTIEDLSYMAAGTDQVSFAFQPLQGPGANQRYLYLDYVELVASVVPERRSACAVRVVSSVYGDDLTTSPPQIFDSSWSRFSKARYPPSSQFLVNLTTPPLPSLYFDLCIREALPVDPSDLLRVQTTLGTLSLFEAVGPSLAVMAITQYQQTQYPQLQTFTGTIIDGQLKSKVLAPFEDYNLSVGAFYGDVATAGSFWAGYRGFPSIGFQEVWGAFPTFGNVQIQRIWVSGGTTYTYVHAVALPGALSANLLFLDLYDVTGTVLLSTQSVSPNAVRALPDRGNGWRIFEVPLTVPLTPAVSGYVNLVAYSADSESAAWKLAVAESVGQQPYFGYDVPGTSPLNGSAEGKMVDRAMYLACPLATPGAPTVTTQTAVSTTPTCDVGVIQWLRVAWTPDASADKYAVEVSTDGITWTRRAIIETFGSTAPRTYDDYGAPWDVPVFYRLVSYRSIDRLFFAGPASAGVTIASGGAVLGFSSDTSAVIYSPTDPSLVSITWTDLNTVSIVQLHGEPFQRALRETEDRGLSFSVQLLVASLSSCSLDDVTVSQMSLAETPFEMLRSWERKSDIIVRFPGGPTRRMTLQLGGMTVTTSRGLYLATVTLTDVSTDGLGFSSDEFSPSEI